MLHTESKKQDILKIAFDNALFYKEMCAKDLLKHSEVAEKTRCCWKTLNQAKRLSRIFH